MPPGWSTDELLVELLQRPRRAFVALPGMRVIRRPGWEQLITPAFSDGGLNEVTLAVLDEADVDRAIDATLADYERLGLRLRWTVDPESRPADLAQRLERRGLRSTMHAAMCRATTEDAPAPAADVRVEEVTTATLASFIQVMAAGWDVPAGPLELYHRAALADPERRLRMFLARHRGVPAAVAAYTAFARSAYFTGAVVLPPFRGRGLYRALVARRLREAARQGIALATSHAQETSSAPILLRMGFETICRFPILSNG